MLSALTGPW